MKKILFIVLAFLLLAGSTSALPWKFNATRDIDWSSYPVQVFTGTTGEELEAFIIAHGAGTYLLKNKVVISEELTISDNYVCIVGSGSLKWTKGDTGTAFEVSMASGRAINISADYVALDHVTVRFTNTSSLATAICINRYWTEIISPSIYAAKGKGIEFIGQSYFYDISNPNINMDDTTGAGTVFYFNSDTNGLIHGGTVGDGAYGAYLIEGHPMFSFVYFLNQSTKGIYFNPSYATSCGDVLFIGGCIDYQGGTAVETSGAYRVDNVAFIGVSYWAEAQHPVFLINNIHNWRISDSQGIRSEEDTPIVIQDKTNGLTITNCEITAAQAGDNGIYVENDTENTNLNIINNQLAITSGTGIIINGASIGTYTVMGNQGTVSAGTPSATKISEHNRDT